MSTNSERILGASGPTTLLAWPLYGMAQTRAMENLHPGACTTLMQQAGLALARLTLALVPHARLVWVACGPGNNGGDGLEAAAHLQQWGKQVVASLVHDPEKSPPDAYHAWQAAQAAGVGFSDRAPAHYDVCVDALFGIGTLRPLQSAYAEWVAQMNSAHAPTIAVDLPSGLDAESGAVSDVHVVAQHTLSLLTLKPGLFTGSGRDACGEVWFNSLAVCATTPPLAWLQSAPAQQPRPHASNKGSYGDVCIVGGASGMRGAVLLAARSALQGGAGRVFVCPLDEPDLALDPQCPELMVRRFEELNWSDTTLVAGCGGGQSIADHLPQILRDAKRLVLDADALNRISESPALQEALRQRPNASTVLTPHPLEAARLLSVTVATVQADRLHAAQALAERFQCVVVLKGSGSIITASGETPRINPTGNAKLATAGTGDVLAGLLGACMANGLPALDAACAAVYRHGLAADRWPGPVLSASVLCQWRD